jgi:hypothetical protein
MNIKQVFIVSALSLAAISSFADSTTPLTRAEVRQSVLDARAAGQLIPAGEGEYPLEIKEPKSDLTRAAVRTEVLQARAEGELIPAGEGPDEFAPPSELSTPSTLTRAEVKAEVLAAAKAGELMPAGEGDEDEYQHEGRAPTPKFITTARDKIAHAFASL